MVAYLSSTEVWRTISMKLEEFRKEDIGSSFFYHSSMNTLVQNTFQQRCDQAFYLSMQCLEDLEHAKYAFPTGRSSTIAIGMWFICVESLINNILKIATESNLGVDFKVLKSKDLSTRLRELIKVIGIDPAKFGKAKLFAQIQEFCEFRNEMFHDRTYQRQMSFHNTMFSNSVVDINQIDVIQAFQIFLKLSIALRYSVSDLDLMPNIFIKSNNKVFFTKLDTLYKKFIIEGFAEILKKHSISSDLALDIPIETQILCQSPIPQGWSVVIKHQQEINQGEVNPANTNILSSKMIEIAKTEANNLTSQEFGLLDYLDRRKR